MKVKFEFENELDIVAAPDGWKWVGSVNKDGICVCLMRIIAAYPPESIGCIVTVGNRVSAGYSPHKGEYQSLGQQSDTRTASVALIRAMGLEVQP